jgi:cell division protein FtsX
MYHLSPLPKASVHLHLITNLLQSVSVIVVVVIFLICFFPIKNYLRTQGSNRGKPFI